MEQRALTPEAARALLAHPSEEEARAAFQVLEAPARSFLRCYLRRVGSEPDAEDLAQEALLKVWVSRERYRDRGTASWFAFLKLVADRCRIDCLRSRGVQVEMPDDLPDEELPLLDAVMAQADAAECAAGCLHAADRLWLELEDGLAPEEHRRRLLAAQLFYLQGAEWSEVLAVLNARHAGAPVRRAELDLWLKNPAILRHLWYTELYLPGMQLAERVRAAGGWTVAEAEVIGWRLAWGLGFDHIAERKDCPVSDAELSALSVRLQAALPFRRRMRELLETVRTRSGIAAAPHLARTGLWQRLAFQYRYWDGLPHRDIQERVAPPAEEVNVEVNAGMLNVWLSGGRLLGRLARHMERHNG